MLRIIWLSHLSMPIRGCSCVCMYACLYVCTERTWKWEGGRERKQGAYLIKWTLFRSVCEQFEWLRCWHTAFQTRRRRHNLKIQVPVINPTVNTVFLSLEHSHCVLHMSFITDLLHLTYPYLLAIIYLKQYCLFNNYSICSWRSNALSDEYVFTPVYIHKLYTNLFVIKLFW